MARFDVSLEVNAPASRVWTALVDWRSHGDWVPLTRVTITSARPDGVGAAFVARTGAGPLAFDDPMSVTAWQPPSGDGPDDRPGRCDIVKHGRLIHGTAWFEVFPLAAGRSRVVWTEDVTVSPVRLTGPFAPVLSLVGRAGFRQTLRAMARQVENRS